MRNRCASERSGPKSFPRTGIDGAHSWEDGTGLGQSHDAPHGVFGFETADIVGRSAKRAG